MGLPFVLPRRLPAKDTRESAPNGDGFLTPPCHFPESVEPPAGAARKPDLPVQEIMDTAPGVNLGTACNTIEDPEMRAHTPILRRPIDRRAPWAGKHYSDRLARAHLFAFSPSSTGRRMASERDISRSCMAIQALA